MVCQSAVTMRLWWYPILLAALCEAQSLDCAECLCLNEYEAGYADGFKAALEHFWEFYIKMQSTALMFR
jgi:hypothetical protein